MEATSWQTLSDLQDALRRALYALDSDEGSIVEAVRAAVSSSKQHRGSWPGYKESAHALCGRGRSLFP